MQGHFNAATALSIASDGWTLLSAGRDNVAILWDLRSYKKTTTIPVFEAIEGMRLLFDTGTLYSRFLGGVKMRQAKLTTCRTFKCRSHI